MTHLTSSAKYLGERGIETFIVSETQLRCSRSSDRTVTLSVTATGYSVSAWDVTPGPGTGDFVLDGLTLDAALLTVWHFFHGTPVQMGGWSIPVHRHPAWALPKLAYCITSASTLDASQFSMLAERRRATRAGASRAEIRSGQALGRYAAALESQFVRCSHVNDPALVLMLRRDLQEACIVRADHGAARDPSFSSDD